MSSLGEKVRRAAALRPHDWLLVVEAWVELARAGLLLRVDAPRAVRGALARRLAPQGEEHDLPPQLLEMFLLAARFHLFHPNCLPKALALKRMLERRRFAPTLRIGARKEGGKLLGHAWIEIDDVPFNDAADIGDRFPTLEVSEAGLAVWTIQ